jgi:hypothetical protein
MSRQHPGDHIRRKQSDWFKRGGGGHRTKVEEEKREFRLVPLAEAEGPETNNSFNSYARAGTHAAARSTERPWPKMAAAAFHGLAGDIVRLIEPHTESDPVALLLNLHAAFGNAIGRAPYYQVEGDRHCTNLFVIQVGDTSKARKGTGVGRIRQLFKFIDPEWDAGRVRNALSSGEGVIWEVRDPITKLKDGVEETIDAGIADKAADDLCVRVCQPSNRHAARG